MSFTGRCNIHDRKLELAFNPDLNIYFANCFECFPIYEKVNAESVKVLKRINSDIARLIK